MSDHELIDQLLDVAPTEATPGNRLKRLDTKYRAPEKLSKLQQRHLLLIQYMIHGVNSPARCRQLRIGVDQPLSLIQAADAARSTSRGTPHRASIRCFGRRLIESSRLLRVAPPRSNPNNQRDHERPRRRFRCIRTVN